MSKNLSAYEADCLSRAITAFRDVPFFVKEEFCLPGNAIRWVFRPAECRMKLDDQMDCCMGVSDDYADCCVGIPLEAVPEHIREEAPSPRVAEALVEWFEGFYAPRIVRLPTIMCNLFDSEQQWDWIEEQAELVGLSGEVWVRTLVMCGRDEILDAVSDQLTAIKADIQTWLFDGE